ncbi:MAG: PAS domain S-box protein, partial [Campylobacterota bacterium]|nr:PAS domain S-box protein [Campylobacterota bacterium]
MRVLINFLKENKFNTKITRYIITLTIILLTVNIILYVEKEMKIDENIQVEIKRTQLYYHTVYEEHKIISEIIYDTDINIKSIIDIFKLAHSSSTQEKIKLRKELYDKLKDTYKKLYKHNLKQLHFHLPDNSSFLRFHKPEKYGDDLTNIRSTVNYVNTNKKYIDSFEEGRVYNGYRYVYPLFDETKKYIGSVEVSFNTISFKEKFYKQFKLLSNFLIVKDVTDNKVFQDEKDNYIKSGLKNFYIEKYPLKKADNSFINYDLASDFPKQTIKKLNSYDLNGEVVTSIEENNLLVFLPVKNNITKSVEAIFVVKHNNNYISNKTKNYYISTVIINLLVVIITYLLYRVNIKQINLQLSNKKLESIISEVDSGICLMDLEGRFIDVNNAYSRILGYSKDELLKLNCLDLTVAESKEEPAMLLNTAKTIGSLSKYHKICIKKDKSLINLEFSLTLLPSGDMFISVINSIEDKLAIEKLNGNLQDKIKKKITELREKDKILFQQSKDAAMGEMIDAIAHQWKNPLGLIRLIGQEIVFLNEEYAKPNNDKVIEEAKKIELQVTHLLNTLEEFRSFFRPNSSHKVIPVEVLLNSVKVLMKDELIKNTIQFQTIGDLNTKIKILPNEFKHVIINLITNSRDAFIQNNV